MNAFWHTNNLTHSPAAAVAPASRGVVCDVSGNITQTEWEDFLQHARPHTFLQSWQWGEFHTRQGNQIFRFCARDQAGEGSVVGVALVVKIMARRATFLFCPHGPVLLPGREAAVMPAMVRAILDQARATQSCFIRISSQLIDNDGNRNVFRRLGFRRAPIHMHPELAWMLDLRRTAEQLLAGMRKTTRYLVRKSLQMNVHVTHDHSASALQQFLQLYQTTAQRHHFIAFPERYVRDEMAAFGPDAQIFLATHDNQVIAGALVVFSGDSAYYHHGASLAEIRVPAAYRLLWEAIGEAKRRGCVWYNFWGIAPDDSPRHPWAGLSLFKQGFGGVSEAYVPAQDYVRSGRYWLNYVVERARRARRGL